MFILSLYSREPKRSDIYGRFREFFWKECTRSVIIGRFLEFYKEDDKNVVPEGEFMEFIFWVKEDSLGIFLFCKENYVAV